MKKRIVALMVVTMLCLAGCGTAEEKVIGGEVNNQVSNGTQTAQGGQTADAGTQQGSTAKSIKGYGFAEKGITVEVDGDMSAYLDTLGEPASYFEAASCAFEGLDKVYTYSSYVIKTYPQGDKDLVSGIILMDDAVATMEGVMIGSEEAAVEKAYGTNYVENGNMHVYSKDGMKLGIIIENGVVTSIQYTSTVLDEN